MDCDLRKLGPFLTFFLCSELYKGEIIVWRDPGVKYRLVIILTQFQCGHAVVQMFDQFRVGHSFWKVPNIELSFVLCAHLSS